MGSRLDDRAPESLHQLTSRQRGRAGAQIHCDEELVQRISHFPCDHVDWRSRGIPWHPRTNRTGMEALKSCVYAQCSEVEMGP